MIYTNLLEQKITGWPELAITLPFQCEVEIVEWRVQGHDNLDLEIKQETNQDRLYYTLSMTLLSTRKAEKKGERYCKYCKEDTEVNQ